MYANLRGEFNVIIISGLNDFFGEKKFNAIREAAANKVYVAVIDTLATIITNIGDDKLQLIQKNHYKKCFFVLKSNY